jgi:hypothetical protein
LFHTFARGCNPGKTDRGYGRESYFIAGDGVKDTPAHKEDTWGYNGWDTCFNGISYDTCPNDQKADGVDPGKDPLLNVSMNSCVDWEAAYNPLILLM